MILIVDMNWKKDSLGYYESVAPLIQVAKDLDEVAVKHYQEVQMKDIVDCSRIILSGTTLKDTTALKEPERFVWLKDIQKPVLGICAGMQIIGLVFNLSLKKCLEIGIIEVDTVKDNPLFSGIFKAYSVHNYALEATEHFEILAESRNCVQAIKHKQKPIYGILFHPEVRNEEIIKNYLKIYK